MADQSVRYSKAGNEDLQQQTGSRTGIPFPLKPLTEEPNSLCAPSGQRAMNRRGEREKAERLQRLMSILDSKPELKQPIVLSENKSTTTDGFIPSQNTLTYHYSEDGIHLDRRCGISAVSSNHGKSVEGLYYLPDSRKFMTLKDTGCGMEISEAVVEDITIKEIDFLLSSVEARR